MDSETLEEQLRRLERKVDTLRWLQAIQTTSIALLGLIYLVKLTPTLVVLFLLIAPALYLFRHSLPGWARWSGRTLSSMVRNWMKVPEAETHRAPPRRTSSR